MKRALETMDTKNDFFEPGPIPEILSFRAHEPGNGTLAIYIDNFENARAKQMEAQKTILPIN